MYNINSYKKNLRSFWQMVFINCPKDHRESLTNFLLDHQIVISSLDRGRFVCHLGINEKDISFVIEVFRAYFKKQ